jgi:hypothetical protein
MLLHCFNKLSEINSLAAVKDPWTQTGGPLSLNASSVPYGGMEHQQTGTLRT